MDHDTHYSNFGKATESCLVVLAEYLTQESFLEGIKARRFYASNDFNFKVNFSIGNTIRGTVFSYKTVS